MLGPRLLRVRLRWTGGNDYVVKERHVGRKAFSLTAPRRRLRPAGRPRYPAPRFRARAPAERHLAPGNVTCPNGGWASQLALGAAGPKRRAPDNPEELPHPRRQIKGGPRSPRFRVGAARVLKL